MERASRYDAIIATLVGVTALLVSAYTAYIQRQQVRAQVYPIVEMSMGWTGEDVHVTIANKGSGPALIRDMRFSVDGKPLHNWLELIQVAVGDGYGDVDINYSSVGRSTFSAGEEKRVFAFACKKPPPTTASPANAPLPALLAPADKTCAAVKKLMTRMTIGICYCSTLDDCMLLEDGPNRDASTVSVRSCPKPTDDSFN